MEHYAAIAEPLVIIKTKGFKQQPADVARARYIEKTRLADYVTKEELEQAEKAFAELKHLLCTAPILAFPDFKRPFILYVDGSKEKGYGVAIY